MTGLPSTLMWMRFLDFQTPVNCFSIAYLQQCWITLQVSDVTVFLSTLHYTYNLIRYIPHFQSAILPLRIEPTATSLHPCIARRMSSQQVTTGHLLTYQIFSFENSSFSLQYNNLQAKNENLDCAAWLLSVGGCNFLKQIIPFFLTRTTSNNGI